MNQLGKLSGCSIAWIYAFSRCWCRAVGCLSQKLGTASGPGDFQLLLFMNADRNSSWIMSSQGWHSVSTYFNSSLFIHSVEWLCSFILQDFTPKCFCCFFFWWFFNCHLFFTKVSEELHSIVSKHLVLLVLFNNEDSMDSIIIIIIIIIIITFDI